MENSFDHEHAEPIIFERWEQAKAFAPQGDGKAFCILIPPPNVTGVLHMGHALNNSLQDVICRLARMRGRKVLWQAGTDHAGIATQMLVERQLAELGKPDRNSMGREQFTKEVWRWKEQSGNAIIEQLKKLGASCDWSRERFTLDEGFCRAVREAFVRLHAEGLIYRDNRLVNWDPKLQTAISDLEVEAREIKGHLWHFKYPLADGNSYEFPIEFDPNGNACKWEQRDYIAIATTRPETMLGDGAVAVHPEDTRYRDLVGSKIILPIAERHIPIIADHFPDPGFGSGAVKITGAHDFNDFQVARRHDLPIYDIMDDCGRMAGEIPERYLGLDRFEARSLVVSEMIEREFLLKIEDRIIQQPHGDRSGSIIEPRLKTQWFVDAKKLAGPAIAAVENGQTRFIPESWANTYFEWMRNIEPWCISRRLWWGHRIPAWYDGAGEVFVAHSHEQAQQMAGEGVRLRQDEDVLDTWFSSSLWPFATLGWPDQSEDLQTFYPSSILVTGFDIIFFWVARMMMQGIFFMKEPPFPKIYVHALVRDASGQKMSKSRGNVVDPMELTSRYGADSLRFTLAAMAVPGRDIKLSEQRIVGYRNLATKLWNAARFCQMRGAARPAEGFDPAALNRESNRWIVAMIGATADKIASSVDEGRLDEAAACLYHFFWDLFCDWYLEMCKPFLGETNSDAETRSCLGWALRQCLLLFQPFMPFITEQIWNELGEDGLLMLQAWPELARSDQDQQVMAEMDMLMKLVEQIRSVRADLSVPPGERIDAILLDPSEIAERCVSKHGEIIARLARLSSFQAIGPAGESGFLDVPASQKLLEASSRPDDWIQIATDVGTLVLKIGDLIDIAEEKRRLGGEIAKRDKEIAALEKNLDNPHFIDRAPEPVIAEKRQRLETTLAIRAKLHETLLALGGTVASG